MRPNLNWALAVAWILMGLQAIPADAQPTAPGCGLDVELLPSATSSRSFEVRVSGIWGTPNTPLIDSVSQLGTDATVTLMGVTGGPSATRAFAESALLGRLDPGPHRVFLVFLLDQSFSYASTTSCAPVTFIVPTQVPTFRLGGKLALIVGLLVLGLSRIRAIGAS